MKMYYFIKDCFQFYNFVWSKGATATLNDKKVCIISGWGCRYLLVSLSVTAAVHLWCLMIQLSRYVVEKNLSFTNNQCIPDLEVELSLFTWKWRNSHICLRRVLLVLIFMIQQCRRKSGVFIGGVFFSLFFIGINLHSKYNSDTMCHVFPDHFSRSVDFL